MPGRIPAALQAVFMASNRGEEVHEAPKEADKVYGSSSSDRRPNARIPFSLQNVFMQSNQGYEVHEPPADKTANKVYRRIWRRQRAEVSPWACLPANYTQTSPQDFFDNLLEDRGYLPLFYEAKGTAYYNRPTKHQMSSYGARMIQAVKGYEVTNFRRMINAGLSPNACNAHGESILHMICRRGHVELFQTLMEAKVDLQVCDDYGRTPMHDACWASSPNFEIALALIRTDPGFLFLRDVRGATPLTYCPKKEWGGWNKFLEMQVVDRFFPEDRVDKEWIPILCLRDPHTRPVHDPKHCIPSSLANMVATGTMHPYEVMLAMTVPEEDDTEYSSSEEEEEEDSDAYDSDDSISDDEGDEVAEAIMGACEHEYTDADGEGCTDTDGEEYTDTDGEGCTESDGEDTTDFDESSSFDDVDIDDIVNYVESLRLHR